MIDLNSTIANIAAFVLGGVSHAVIFHYGEWDLATTRLIGLLVASQVFGTLGLLYQFPETYDSPRLALSTVVGLTFYLISGLTSSILIYRGFFHRLNKFPGPFVARLSNLYPTALSAKRLHLYEEVQSLHKQYGDYVRLGKYIQLPPFTFFQMLIASGPSELSINDPEAVAAIHGAQSKCVKGPWYNILHPRVSLQMIRNKPEHIRRRKVWDRGFSAKGILYI
jgi:hypothetical protein